MLKFKDDSCGLALDSGAVFSRRLSSVGDLDGDGIHELAVCAPLHFEKNATNSGAVYIFFFDRDGEIRSRLDVSQVSGGFAGKLTAVFAMDVAGLGDVDGNGTPDIAVSEQNADNGRGAVWILFLQYTKTGGFSVKSSTKIHPDNGSGFTELASYVGTNFGNTLTGIGDLNQDGIPDMAVGTSRHENEAGSVWILFLNKDGTVKKHQEISNAKGNLGYVLLEDDFFGVSITSLGDLNADGFTDIAVGAHQENSGGINKGGAYILFLNKQGSVSKSQKISNVSVGLMASIANKTFLGLGLDGESDLNGDGINDLVMGGGGDGDFFFSVVCYLDGNGQVTSYEKFDKSSRPYTNNFKATSRLFTAIGSMGDMNGDGIPEMAVGAMDEGANGAFCLLMSGDLTISREDVEGNTAKAVWDMKMQNQQCVLNGPEASYEIYSISGQQLAKGHKEEGAFAIKDWDSNDSGLVVLVVFDGTTKEVYRFFDYQL